MFCKKCGANFKQLELTGEFCPLCNTSTNNHESNAKVTVALARKSSNGFGIASLIFGIIGIFIFSPIFVPLSIVSGIIALVKRQLAFGIIGLICAAIGFVTSPILMMSSLALVSMGTLMETEVSSEKPTHSQTTPHSQPQIVTPKILSTEPQQIPRQELNTNAENQQPNQVQPTEASSPITQTVQNPNSSLKVDKDNKIAEYKEVFSGKWIGTYICGQGVTGLTLDISNTSHGMNAIFNFYPIKQNPKAMSGSFSSSGEISIDGKFKLNPNAWIKRPPGYMMVGMSGKISDDRKELTGSLDSGCSSFHLSR